MHLIIRDKDEVILAAGQVQVEDKSKSRAILEMQVAGEPAFADFYIDDGRVERCKVILIRNTDPVPSGDRTLVLLYWGSSPIFPKGWLITINHLNGSVLNARPNLSD